MTRLDFAEVNQEKVGYLIKANDMLGPSWLGVLTFEQFIPPYSRGANTHQEVYQNLEQALDSAREQQDSVTDHQRSVMMDVLATATLQRESMMNAMRLIQDHYL